MRLRIRVSARQPGRPSHRSVAPQRAGLREVAAARASRLRANPRSSRCAGTLIFRLVPDLVPLELELSADPLNDDRDTRSTVVGGPGRTRWTWADPVDLGGPGGRGSRAQDATAVAPGQHCGRVPKTRPQQTTHRLAQKRHRQRQSGVTSSRPCHPYRPCHPWRQPRQRHPRPASRACRLPAPRW
jgi:hypothetical protein